MEGDLADCPPDDSCSSPVVTSVIDPIQIIMQDIHDALYALDPNSAAGQDGVHPVVLCDCSESLAYPLFKIFSLSLAEACLPLEWKTSTVTPIFKKGSRYSPLNYRPISLTSVPCKCLERIIVNHLNSYLADQLGKLRGGDQKIDQSGRSNALIWSYLQSLNKTPFLDDSGGKSSPYNHQVKEKICFYT